MARATTKALPSVATAVPSVGGRRRRTRTTERAASVLVPAFNEEQNIAALLRRVSGASGVDGWLVDDIILVASGCSDGTVARARSVRADGLAVRIIEQETREGKAAAINLGLSVAHHDVIVLVSGDVLPAPGAITALLKRFEDERVGVVGARPVPLNDESTFTGYATHLMWRLHDSVNRAAGDDPKCGELIAFRKRQGDRSVVPAIPMDTAVDEVSIQCLARNAGLRSAYAPDAVVNNWGPSTVRDWFRQRRRIASGHIISAREGYQPSTMQTRTVVRSLLRDAGARRRPLWLGVVVALEVGARVLGYWDVTRGRGHAVWKVAQTTKRAIGEEVI